MELTIPIRLTQDDLEAIAAAVAARLQPELKAMSDAQKQELADIAAIQADVSHIAADLEALATRLSTSNVDPAVVQQLHAAAAALHGKVGELDSLATPPAPTP